MEDKDVCRPEPSSRSKPIFSHGAFSIDSLLKPQLSTNLGDRFQGFRPTPPYLGLLPEKMSGSEDTLQDNGDDTIEYNEDSGLLKVKRNLRSLKALLTEFQATLNW